MQLFILRATLLILFAVSLFFVLFLANGFNYDFVSNQIRRTGIVDVAFTDTQAQVLLDGRKLDGSLPFVVSNVLPGKYDLSVMRPGYWGWDRQITVRENIIEKIDDVLLYPLDEHSISKILIETDDLQSSYILRDGYFFKISGKTLSFQELSDNFSEAESTKVELPLDGIPTIQVRDARALLTWSDGKRYLLDLTDGLLKPLNAHPALVYAFDQWIYRAGNLVAVFDLNLKNVKFAQEFLGEQISDVKDFDVDGKRYMLITKTGEKTGSLYQYTGADLALVAKDVTQKPLDDGMGHLLIMNKRGELWRYDESSQKSSLIGRFSGDSNLRGFALNKAKSAGQLLWENSGTLYVADTLYTNVRVMFAKIQILDMILGENGRVYYLEKIQTDSPDHSTKIRLMAMDLDI